MPHQVPTVSVAELPTGATLLDVREDAEWVAGHAPDAVHIPMGELVDRLQELPAEDPLYVICRSGGRSARVAMYLNANGWDATNVEGGMQSWSFAGRPMVCELAGEPEVI
jgi:rhodanese-related sulfurtransferase